MSLKNILGKITASIVALYLVLGNFAVAGLGIAEVTGPSLVFTYTAVALEFLTIFIL